MESLFLMELENEPCTDRVIRVRLAWKWLETEDDGSVVGLNLILNEQSMFRSWFAFSTHNYFRCFAVMEQWCSIPEEIFGFFNLKNIPAALEQDSNLIDVVGIIEDVKYPQIISNRKNNQQIYRDFVITDLVESVKVRFWDQFALHFDNLLNEASVRPVIIIISSCKMNRNNYNGVTTLTNMPATIISMNGNCSRVDDLRQRFWEVNGL
ncbi:hypothetical protein DCAR_0623434 [Daucus carota subsp. sativus]|uniref:Uncharacterized protein n=1 Tax=Daucus carota subsp. sativus TaxID=79200 RepID=A0A175YBM8_DAUCS|nr:hypothetical protein DCAR_0623434 [Daucus carota subsp. sativus]